MPVQKGEKRGSYKKSSKVFPTSVEPVETKEAKKALEVSMQRNEQQAKRWDKAGKSAEVEAINVYIALQRNAIAEYRMRATDADIFEEAKEGKVSFDQQVKKVAKKHAELVKEHAKLVDLGQQGYILAADRCQSGEGLATAKEEANDNAAELADRPPPPKKLKGAKFGKDKSSSSKSAQAEINAEIAKVNAEINAEIDKVNAETKAQLSAIEQSTYAEIDKVNAETEAARSATEQSTNAEAARSATK